MYHYLPIITIALFAYCLMFESKAKVWKQRYKELERSIRDGTYR